MHAASTSTSGITSQYVPPEDMAADILTKALSRDKHMLQLHMLGLRSASSAVGVLVKADISER
jgi:hypothetical protein